MIECEVCDEKSDTKDEWKKHLDTNRHKNRTFIQSRIDKGEIEEI